MAKALSSEISWKILEILMRKELEEKEIISHVGFPPALVKLHLRKLIESGILVAKEKTLPNGKETTLYGLASTHKSIEVPPRNYLFLCDALINYLTVSLGDDAAKTVLRDMGIRIVEDIGHSLRSKTSFTEWAPRNYADVVIKGLLVDMQTYPKVIKVEEDRVIYQQKNCPFEELSVKYPTLMCDVLDEAVHEGLDKKLGGMKTVRLKCRAHGDPVCKFHVNWPRKDSVK